MAKPANAASVGRREPMPEFIDPMLATLVAAPFDDPEWSFEIKWDGFRVETVVDRGQVRLWTRGRQDAARYFGPFLDPPDWIAAKRAIVDGLRLPLDEGLRLEGRLFVELQTSPDAIELEERASQTYAEGGSPGL